MWRLMRPEHAPGLDGEGARLFGGRWNSPGRPLVYCSGSLALAALEYFVHVPASMRQAGKLPPLKAVELDLPDGVAPDRGEASGEAAARNLGDGWLKAGKCLVLVVPSAVITLENNILLNPLHADIAAVRLLRMVDFVFDPRLGAAQ